MPRKNNKGSKNPQNKTKSKQMNVINNQHKEDLTGSNTIGRLENIDNTDTPLEITQSDLEEAIGGINPFGGEEPSGYLIADFADEEYDRLIDSYTDDEDVQDLLSDRQRLNRNSPQLMEELQQHHSRSPDLSAGDIDADWQGAYQSGEETVGGSVSTPDQDIVDELGEAVGLTYRDNEPLRTEEKLDERDRNRFELDPEISIDADLDQDEEETETVKFAGIGSVSLEEEEDWLDEDDLVDMMDLEELDDLDDDE